MAKTFTLTLTLVAMLCLPIAFGALAFAQDKSKDDALDGLLKKLEEKPSTPSDPATPKSRAETPAPKGSSESTGGKPKSDLPTKDKSLDSLLEKLGTTEDKPSAEERPNGPGGARGEPQPGGEGKSDKDKKNKPDALTGKDKATDEHLEEILGKRKKKKSQAEDSGPLSQVIKEMREVEERLGKPDTGEETRKKQTEIVKKIDTLIEQMRNAQSQPQSKKKSQQMAKGKQQQGQQQGEQAGTQGGNAPFAKPAKPNERRSLAGGKEIWGMLPPEVRQELENVSKEGFLLSHEELIQRYYLSLSKKKVNRGE